MEADNKLRAVLIRMILEQYKQERAFTELDKLGAFLHRLIVNNLGIVFTAIGFPEDNASEYDLLFEAGASRDESKKLHDDDCFCCEWLEDQYYKMTNDLEEKEIVITETGIDVRDVSDLDLLTEKIDAYIDWL